MFDLKKLLKNKYFYSVMGLWGGLFFVFLVVIGVLCFFLDPLVLYPIVGSYYYICCLLFLLFILILYLKLFNLLVFFDKVTLENSSIMKYILSRIMEKVIMMYNMFVDKFSNYLFQIDSLKWFFSIKYIDFLEFLFSKDFYLKSADFDRFLKIYVFILYFPTVLFLCVLCVEVILYNQIYYSYFLLVFMIINRLVRFFLFFLEIYLVRFFDVVIKDLVILRADDSGRIRMSIDFKSYYVLDFLQEYQKSFCEHHNITKEMCDGDAVWLKRMVDSFQDKYLFFYQSVSNHLELLRDLLRKYYKHILMISFIRIMIVIVLIIYVLIENLYILCYIL